jgi:hypothetical protein
LIARHGFGSINKDNDEDMSLAFNTNFTMKQELLEVAAESDGEADEIDMTVKTHYNQFVHPNM